MDERIVKIVKENCDEEDWKYHISIVIRYSKLLAENLDANVELAELGALLHDIGRIKYGGKDHEKTGISEAEKILSELKYPKETIEEVKHIIESHRSDTKIKPRTITAKIVANADAMAHFDTVAILVRVATLELKKDAKGSVKWVYDKLQRDWNKLTILEAKKMMKEKYEAAKIILSSTMQYDE